MACLPIKNIEEINLIKDFCKKKNKIQELLIFTLAINTGADVKDLLNLKVKDVKDKLYLKVFETKIKSVPLTDDLIELIKKVISGKSDSDFLFERKKGKVLDRTTVYYVFKDIYNQLGLNADYTIASWRKTFAYHHYQKYKDIAYLMWLFNQSTVQVAFKFIDVKENMNLRFKEGVCL